jgi:hypothetical protein
MYVSTKAGMDGMNLIITLITEVRIIRVERHAVPEGRQ